MKSPGDAAVPSQEALGNDRVEVQVAENRIATEQGCLQVL